MDDSTAWAGVKILDAIRLSLRGFVSLARDSGAGDYEIASYVAWMERALDALSAWTMRTMGHERGR